MTDTTTFKTKLETELEIVTKELQSVGIRNPEVASDWVAVAKSSAEADENVHADANEELENRTAIVADLETRYNNIVRALKKIEDGTYGICEVSGKPIEQERLEANPAARTCIAHMDDESSLTG